jgi:hypothetical protein
VRASNTILSARVAGHITAILSGDNTIVKKGGHDLLNRRWRLPHRSGFHAYEDRHPTGDDIMGFASRATFEVSD